MRNKTFFALLPLLLALAAGSGTAHAQAAAAGTTASADEQAIRTLVQQQNEGKAVIKSTDDRVFVSGPFPRPYIGQGTPESQRISDSLRTARSNVVTRQNIVRLEVAQAGDMAYEYGTGTLEFDEKNNNHIKGETAYLRVWKKVGGTWIVAAYFARLMFR